MIEIIIGEDQEQQRLDRFLKKYLPEAPLSYIYKMVRKDVKINGKRVKPESILVLGDTICLYIPTEEVDRYARKKEEHRVKKQFTVVYEDENMVIVNKPKGILTHGDSEEKKNTLVNQVVGYLVEKGDYAFSRNNTFIPAPVNRLDRNTSGIVIFGKNNVALQNLNKMIKDKKYIKKYYLAIAEGELHQEITLRSTMIKDEKLNKITVKEQGEGKSMETIIRPLSYKSGYTLVEAELVTGRTHQIRAHLANQNLYIIGDIKYGSPKGNRFANERFGLTTQFLHAYKLKFENCPEPFTYMNGKEIMAPLSSELADIKAEMFDHDQRGKGF